jgi:hypothetical protein
MCKPPLEGTPQRGMFWPDQRRILVEDCLRMSTSFEKQRRVLGEIAEPQTRGSGLPRTE